MQMKFSFFPSSSLSSLERSHVASSLQPKSRKGLACGASDTFATHAGHYMTSLILTARHTMAGRVFVTSKRPVLTIRANHNPQNVPKTVQLRRTAKIVQLRCTIFGPTVLLRVLGLHRRLKHSLLSQVARGDNENE